MTVATTSNGLLGNQLVTSRKAPKGRDRNLARIIPASLIFLALITELWVRIEILRTGYVLETFRASALKNDVLLRDLNSQYALYTSPARISNRAQENFSLRPTTPQRVRRLVLEER